MGNKDLAPSLHSLMDTGEASFGVSHSHVPIESRSGHISIVAGFTEIVSVASRGWEENPVTFDTLFNRSIEAFQWGSEDITHLFSHIPQVRTVSFPFEGEDFSSLENYKLDEWVFDQCESSLGSLPPSTIKGSSRFFFLHLVAIDTNGHGHQPDILYNQPNCDASTGSIIDQQASTSTNSSIVREDVQTTSTSNMAEQFRSSHLNVQDKVTTRSDFVRCIKEKVLDKQLLINIHEFSSSQIKGLICGLDLSALISLIDSFGPSKDASEREGLRALEHAIMIRRQEISVASQAATEGLSSLSMTYLKDVDSEAEGFLICLNEGIICDPLKVLRICYKQLGKTDQKSFLREYLKQVLRMVLLEHQRSVVYLEKVQKKVIGGFILPPNIVEILRKISRRMFNVHTLSDESTDELRQFKRLRHDDVFKSVLIRALETFRQGKIKNIKWLPNCVFNDNREAIQEEGDIVFLNETTEEERRENPLILE